MRLPLFFFVVLVVFSCGSERRGDDDLYEITISSPVIRNVILETAEVRKSNLLLMYVSNMDNYVDYSLYEFYTTCSMGIGDEAGRLVGEEWQNATPPLLRTSVEGVDVYIVTGAELLSKSRERYRQMLRDTEGRAVPCFEAYDPTNDSFTSNAPWSSMRMPWRVRILKYSQTGGENTQALIYRPHREGYDDASYAIDTVRIDTNYRERYY